MPKSKTEQLAELVRAGSRRIAADSFHVSRWVPSRQEWVTDASWRSDVVRRVAYRLHAAGLKAKAGSTS